MQRADSLEKTPMPGKIEGRRRWGPGVLQSMGSQRVGHDWATEIRQQNSWILSDPTAFLGDTKVMSTFYILIDFTMHESPGIALWYQGGFVPWLSEVLSSAAQLNLCFNHAVFTSLTSQGAPHVWALLGPAGWYWGSSSEALVQATNTASPHPPYLSTPRPQQKQAAKCIAT